MTGTTSSENLFWDSCVVIRYLTGTPPDYVADIAKFLDEAMARPPKRRIYISSIMVPEVRPQHLKQKNYTDFQALINDLQGAFTIVNPNMNILMQASRLRGHQYFPKVMQAKENKRTLSGMDSVHLATCLYVRDVLKIRDVVFHTLDDGKSKNYEEKAVSLLNYQKFCEHVANDPDVAAVCKLERCKPIHPSNPLV